MSAYKVDGCRCAPPILLPVFRDVSGLTECHEVLAGSRGAKLEKNPSTRAPRRPITPENPHQMAFYIAGHYFCQPVIPADNHRGCAGPGTSPSSRIELTTGWIPARATARSILSMSNGWDDGFLVDPCGHAPSAHKYFLPPPAKHSRADCRGKHNVIG